MEANKNIAPTSLTGDASGDAGTLPGLLQAEAEADIAFLLLRCECAGSVNFASDRWTGMSSNALVALAYGGEQKAMPHDRSDYAACVRTFVRLPRHRRTPEVRAGLKRAREAYLANCPIDRFPGPRNAQRAEWEATERVRREKEHKRWLRNRKRRAA